MDIEVYEVYLNEMDKVKLRASDAIRVAREGLAMKERMGKLSESSKDPDVALDVKQEAALTEGQLALTEAVDAPLAAAKVALE